MPTITELTTYTTDLANLRTNFKKADTDGSGGISAAEFEAVAKASAGLSGKDGLATVQIFKKIDTDGDGAITQSELSQGINLAAQVQSVLIKGQELMAGSAYMNLLGTGSTKTGSLYDSMFSSGTSSLFGGNSFADLTGSLLGGASSRSSLTTLITGANANTSLLSSLGGGNNALIESLVNRYTAVGDTS